MRQLKHHEQKLLKKVDFLSVSHVPCSNTCDNGGGWSNLQWKQDASHREVKVMRKYHIQDREDYHKYVYLFNEVQELMVGTTSYVDQWDHLCTNYHFYRLKTHFELRRNRKCSTSYTIWASWVCLLSVFWPTSTNDQTWTLNHPISKTN